MPNRYVCMLHCTDRCDDNAILVRFALKARRGDMNDLVAFHGMIAPTPSSVITHALYTPACSDAATGWPTIQHNTAQPTQCPLDVFASAEMCNADACRHDRFNRLCPDIPDTSLAHKFSTDQGSTWSTLRILDEVIGK